MALALYTRLSPKDPAASNFVFNAAYYLVWHLVRAGCSAPNGHDGPALVRELQARLRPVVLSAQSFEQARHGLDAQVVAWRSKLPLTPGFKNARTSHV